MTQLPRHLLPASLLQLADYCGDRVMWLIWEQYGGVHLYVPYRAIPGHPLTELLGPSAAKLTDAFGGEILNIPKADAARLAVRNALIRQEWREGQRLAEIARRYRLTERQINKICRAGDSLATRAMNGDLFSL